MTIIKKNKMIFALFVLSIIGIVLSFFTYQKSIEKIERENFKEYVRNHTKIELASIKDHISDMVYDLNSVAQIVAEYDSIWNPHIKEILSIANRIDMFSSIAVVDADGNGYNDKGKEFNIAEKEYFQLTMQGTVAFSDVQLSKINYEKNVQIFACPIWSENKQVTGAVLGEIDIEYLNQVIANKNNESVGNIYIVDSDGIYISSFQANTNETEYENFWKDLETLTSINRDVSEIKSDFEERKEGDFSFCDYGECQYTCYMPIGTRNWQIVYTVQDTSVEKTLDTIFQTNTKHRIFVTVCYLTWLFCVIWYYNNTNKEIKNAHKEISKNINILHIALEHSKQPIFEYNQNTRQLTFKTDFPNYLFLGKDKRITPESLVEENIISPQNTEAFIKLFSTIETHQEAKADIQINNGQEVLWYRISLHNVYKDNIISGTVGFVEDITEIKIIEQQTERKLELQEALIAKALLYAKIDLEKDNLIEINGEEIQISYDEFLKTNIVSHISSKDKDYVFQELSLQTLHKKAEHGTDMVETQFMMTFDGTEKWVSCMEYFNSVQHSKLILIISDIDQKKRQEIALQHKAERDGLTGLYNAITARAKIEEALLSRDISNEKQMFILFDLDNYKQINDTFGHSCGDQVLIDVSQVLKNQFRSSDIIGRMGGDEFVVLLRNVNSEKDTERLLKELCKIIYKTYEKNGKEVVLSVSVGVSFAPKDGSTFTELYQKSDIALYQIKKQSKNGYKYYNEFEQI